MKSINEIHDEIDALVDALYMHMDRQPAPVLECIVAGLPTIVSKYGESSNEAAACRAEMARLESLM